MRPIGRSLGSPPRNRLSSLLLRRRAYELLQDRLRSVQDLPRKRMSEADEPALGHYSLGSDDDEREYSSLPGQPEESLLEDHRQRS